VWGAPFAVPSKAVRATLCGLRMDRETRVEPLASAFDAEGEQLHIRVGVASGVVLAGNMGSAERMNYTVIGDAVNLASRIEALNKQLGTRVSVCDATAKEVGQLFVLRTLVNVAVVGKKDGVRVHEVVGLSAAPGAEDLAWLRREHDDYFATGDGATDDTASQMSRISVRTTETERSGRKIASALTLVDAARCLQPQPLAATAAQVAFARQFTEATEAYIAGRISEAAAMLATLGVMERSAAESTHEHPRATAFAASTNNDAGLPGSNAELGDDDGAAVGPFPSTGGFVVEDLGTLAMPDIIASPHHAPQSPAAAASPSMSLLRSIVGDAMSSPPADMRNWDGIWRAHEK
jgi:hypothetical protein